MNYKKLSFVTLALIGIFFFGCGEEELPIESDFETYTGELKSLGGIKINKQISHFFETDDGEVLYAYSDKYDLNADEYFGEKIQAYGLVMTFESIDKEVFEIRKISEAKIDTEESDSVENVEYIDTGLGFKFSYPDNWEIEEFADFVKLTAPMIEDTQESDQEDVVAKEDVADGEEDESASEAGVVEPDYAVFALTNALLTKSAEDTLDDRASEIRDFARSNYDNLVGVASELSYLGVDQVFAVKFKLQNGDIYYFTPKNSQLFEISFNHPSEEDRINNTNIFSEIIGSFRFIPEAGEEDGEESGEEDNDEAVESEGTVNIEKNLADNDSDDAAQETSSNDTIDTVEGYRAFESTPYQFKISYPEDWYYSGGNYGYDFHDEPIEEDTDALIRVDLINSGTAGTSYSGNEVFVTVKMENRSYTVSGPKAYESIIVEMANSIVEITE